MDNEMGQQKQSSSLTNWANPPTAMDLKTDYDLAKEFHSGVVTQIDTYLDNLHVRGKAKLITEKRTVVLFSLS